MEPWPKLKRAATAPMPRALQQSQRRSRRCPPNMPGEPAAKVYVIEDKRVELESPAKPEPEQAEAAE